VHLYDNSELNWHLEDGTELKVSQKTNYPWDGLVDISVAPAKASQFTLFVRVPGWAQDAQVSVNGKAIGGARPGEYLPIQRLWTAGDSVRLQLDMRPQLLEANARVVEDNGRVAVQRGPIIYCLEEIDQPSGTPLADAALDFTKSREAGFKNEYKGDLLDGVVVLRHPGILRENSGPEPLYSQYDPRPQKTKEVPLTFIPYYAWANRQPSAMEVWTPVFRT